jgi:gas vesicle protein
MYEPERMDETGGGFTGFAIGMACGAAIGAALALMYAPKPGQEMRRQLADQTDRVRRRASEQAGRVRQRAGEMYSGASDTFNYVVEKGREAMDVGRDAFRQSRPHNGPASDMSMR